MERFPGLRGSGLMLFSEKGQTQSYLPCFYRLSRSHWGTVWVDGRD